MTNIFLDPQRRLRNGWKCLAFFAGAAVCFATVGMSSRLLPHAIKVYLPNALLVLLASLLLSWVAVRLEGARLTDIGWRLDGHFLRQSLGGMFAGAALLLATALMVLMADGFHWTIASTPPTLAVEAKAMLVFLGGAVFEELVMRGYAFQRAVRGVGATWSVVIFGVIFCALHLPGNLEYSPTLLTVAMLDIFAASVMLSLCYLRTGSLALPIGLHFGWNLTQESLGFGVSGIPTHGWLTPVFHQQPDWLTGGAFGLEASALSLVAEVAAIVWLWRRPTPSMYGVRQQLA